MEEEAQALPDHCELAAFETAAKEYPELYVILASDNCGPCVDLMDAIAKADIPHPLVRIPVDECPNIVEHFKTAVFPTVVHLQRGKEVGRLEGSQEEVIQKLKEGK